MTYSAVHLPWSERRLCLRLRVSPASCILPAPPSGPGVGQSEHRLGLPPGVIAPVSASERKAAEDVATPTAGEPAMRRGRRAMRSTSRLHGDRWQAARYYGIELDPGEALRYAQRRDAAPAAAALVDVDPRGRGHVGARRCKPPVEAVAEACRIQRARSCSCSRTAARALLVTGRERRAATWSSSKIQKPRASGDSCRWRWTSCGCRRSGPARSVLIRCAAGRGATDEDAPFNHALAVGHRGHGEKRTLRDIRASPRSRSAS